jgi:hypothetical protein
MFSPRLDILPAPQRRLWDDIHAVLRTGLSLAHLLAAAEVIYGSGFSPLVALKAVSYHDDATLTSLPMEVRRDLVRAVRTVDPRSLPELHPLRRHQEWA